MHVGFVAPPKDNLGMMHPSPRLASFAESSVHTPQVAVVSGGVESVLTSPSPPG